MRSASRPSTVSARAFFSALSAVRSANSSINAAADRSRCPSGRRSKIRSSAIFASSGGMRCSGRIFDTCTIAPVMPAAQRMVEEHAVQHCRAGGFSPNEMFDRPRMIWQSGIASASRDRLQRIEAELAVVLVAGADREGQRIEQQIGLRQAVLVAGEIEQPAGDRELVLGLLRHAGLVDGQRDHRGAEPLRQAQPLGRRPPRRPRN